MKKIVKSINIMDGINTKILLLTVEARDDKILHDINNSLQKEIFPSSWKMSITALVEKKADTIKSDELRQINMETVL